MMQQIIFKFLLVSLTFGFCFGCQTARKMLVGGGVEYVVQLETNEPNREEAFKRAVARIQKFADARGAIVEIEKMPDFQDQIRVKIYEKGSVEQLRDLMFTNYVVEFRKAIVPSAPNSPISYSSEEAARKALGENQEVLFYDNPAAYIPGVGRSVSYVIVEKNSIMTGDDIKDAESVTSEAGVNYPVNFYLTPAGAAKFNEWAEKNPGGHLAMIINKEVRSVAAIRSKVSDAIQLSGRIKKQESENIALAAKTGQVPVTYKILSAKPFRD